jgi:hypothetical protein
MTQVSSEDMADIIKNKGGAPKKIPELSLSPCLKVKDSGVVHIWNESLAQHSDLCVNCDEFGNEDPATWRGRGPNDVQKVIHVSFVPPDIPGLVTADQIFVPEEFS